MKLENLLESRYKKLRAIGSTAIKLQKERPEKMEIQQAAEKFIRAGKITQTAPDKVKV